MELRNRNYEGATASSRYWDPTFDYMLMLECVCLDVREAR